MSENLFGKSGGGLAGGLSGGLQMAAVALLVQQLMKHSRSEEAPTSAQAPAQAPQADGGGGLGGLLGGLLGGGAAGGLLSGLGGLLGGLRSQGLERHVDSWVRPGPNEQVSADELSRAFDSRDVDAAAQQAGTDRGTLMNEVSRIFPDMVDRMTPQGRLPQHESEVTGGSFGGLLNSVFGGGQNPSR